MSDAEFRRDIKEVLKESQSSLREINDKLSDSKTAQALLAQRMNRVNEDMADINKQAKIDQAAFAKELETLKLELTSVKSQLKGSASASDAYWAKFFQWAALIFAFVGGITGIVFGVISALQ